MGFWIVEVIGALVILSAGFAWGAVCGANLARHLEY